jgi:hypothetical protein
MFESKLEQNVKDITAVTDEISSKVTGVEVELNNKFEKVVEVVYEVDGKVNKLVQLVQGEIKKGTEDNLKRQGRSRLTTLRMFSPFVQIRELRRPVTPRNQRSVLNLNPKYVV